MREQREIIYNNVDAFTVGSWFGTWNQSNDEAGPLSVKWKVISWVQKMKPIDGIIVCSFNIGWRWYIVNAESFKSMNKKEIIDKLYELALKVYDSQVKKLRDEDRIRWIPEGTHSTCCRQ